MGRVKLDGCIKGYIFWPSYISLKNNQRIVVGCCSQSQKKEIVSSGVGGNELLAKIYTPAITLHTVKA